jgi:hypothetical protein
MGPRGKGAAKVRMMSGEAHRERVQTAAEEAVYLINASPLLHDMATIVVDCALRPEAWRQRRLSQAAPDVPGAIRSTRRPA